MGYSRGVSPGQPDRSGRFEMRYWDGEVVRSRFDLYAVAQIRGAVSGGPAAGLSDPVVLTVLPSVDLSEGFRLEAGDVWLSSSGAAVPQGQVNSPGYRYWLWDAPCVAWQTGDELEFRVVVGDGAADDPVFVDASLGSLEIVGGALDSVFDPTATDHFATADADVETITVTAAAGAAQACGVEIAPADADPVADGHQVDLGDDGAVVAVTVTAADNTTTGIHTLTISRGGAGPAAAAKVSLGGIGDVGFEPLTRRYDTAVPPGVSSTRVEMTRAGDTVLAGYALTAGDTEITTVAPDGTVELSPDADTLVIVRAATPNNERQSVYTMRLRAPRQTHPHTGNGPKATDRLLTPGTVTDAIRSDNAARSGEPRLSGLTLSPGTLTPPFAASTFEYTATVPHDTAQVTVAPTAAEGSTTMIDAPDADSQTDGYQITLNAPTADSPAQTVIVIAVTDTNGQIDSYTLTITRTPQSASDAALAALAFDDLHPQSATNTAHIPDLALDLYVFYPLQIPNGRPGGIWSDGTTMWVSDFGGDMWAYDLSSKKLVLANNGDTPTPGRAGNDQVMGMWSDGDTLWASDYADDKIYAYDLATRARDRQSDIDTLGAAGNRNPKGLWSDGDIMWVVDPVVYRIFAYDLATGDRESSRDISITGTSGYAHGLWSDGVTMWVADSANRKIYAFDLATGDRRPYLDFNTLVAAGNRLPLDIWSDGVTMRVVDSVTDRIYAYEMPPYNLLRSLELTGIDAGFSYGNLDYTVEVPNTTASTTVVAVPVPTGAVTGITPSDADDQTTGYQVDLAEGTNTITVTVQSSDGTVDETYTVTVNRASAVAWSVRPDFELLASGNDNPYAIWSNGVTMWVSDDRDDTIYAYDLATKVRQVDLAINDLGVAGNENAAGLWSDGATMWVADHADAKIYAYDLATGVRDPDSDIDSLSSGNRSPRGIWSDSNIMWVIDNVSDRLYAYDMPPNALLGSLEIVGVDIGSFLPGRFEYSVEVPNATTSVTINAVPVHSGALVAFGRLDAEDQTVGHQVVLVEGDNTVTITVTNGADTATYTVVVTRAS